MALLVFPTCALGVSAKDVRIETARISGGTSLSGIEDVIATDGGGKWAADADSIALHTRDKVMMLRAFGAATHGWIDPFIFPICDARHQPTRGKQKVPHSDGTPFSDETLYASPDCEVYVAADAPLRATQIQLNIASLGKPLIGGERFTIVHPTWRERAYEVGRIISQTASSAVVQFHTPLREAVTAGTAVDFNNPRFVARAAANASAPLSNPKFATGSIRFVEDMSGSYA